MSTEMVPNIEGGIDKVQVVDGIVVTDGFYHETYVKNGMLLRRYHDVSSLPHEDSGEYAGMIHDGKFVPIDSFVPDGMKYGPEDAPMVSGIRLLDDRNISGLDTIYGDKSNGTPVSRYLTEEDCEELVDTKIERGILEADMNFLKARLELDDKLEQILGFISLDEYHRITKSPGFISPNE